MVSAGLFFFIELHGSHLISRNIEKPVMLQANSRNSVSFLGHRRQRSARPCAAPKVAASEQLSRLRSKRASRGDCWGSEQTMEKPTLAVFVTVAFSLVGVVGDYFLKLASAHEHPFRTGWFYLGFGLYAQPRSVGCS